MARAALPASLAHRSVRELSMGQRRKAVLAVAPIEPPRYALLDEPLETMDRAARAEILEWIGQLLDAGATVIVVSHDIEPLVTRAARALALRGGRLTKYEVLPEDWGERLAMLDRLARGSSSSPISTS
jgi:ABC-type Mn2+/Zn2+ transport system ATPase subunit